MYMYVYEKKRNKKNNRLQKCILTVVAYMRIDPCIGMCVWYGEFWGQ